jgi:CubicO group peptidase (beta-lactamase class C family)
MTRPATVVIAAIAAAVLMGSSVFTAPIAGAAHIKHCSPQSGRNPERATPAEVGMDAGTLARAMSFAASRNRLNVQVYRSNCLVASGPLNALTGHTPWNIWSVTKSVVSLVTGIAVDRGELDVHAPIGRYLPPGQGDAAHRAIRVEDLMHEASGLRQAVAAEGITGVIPIDPDSPVQALGLPLDHRPGTVFGYSQRTVDLLVYVVQNAIGEDFQTFAQRYLFGPMGIATSDYYWKRDRSGHTYGYAHLMLPPDDLAKIGLLLGNGGNWAGRQLVSQRYLRAATTPSKTNSCYGYLIWLTGPGCAEPVDNLPPGSFATSGMLSQNNFVVPGLDLVVDWTGVGGTVTSQGLVGELENTAEVAHNFMRGVFASIRDGAPADRGPYVEPPQDPLTVSEFVTPDVLAAVLGLGPDAYPGCTVFSCLGMALAPPLIDAPPGCVVVACVGPDPRTPGIKN